MVNLPSIPGVDRPTPGRVAHWKVNFHAETPDTAGQILAALGAGSLPDVGAAVGGAVSSLLAQNALPPQFRSISRDDFFGTVEIDAQPGLSGAGLTFELERVTRQDYESLARALEICTAAQVALIAEVKLGWSGSNLFDFLALNRKITADGLFDAGRFVVTDVTARVEGAQLRMTITGRDFITHRLSETRITNAAPSEDFVAAARAVLDQAGLSDTIEPAGFPIPIELPFGGGAAENKVTLQLGQTALTQLQELAGEIEASENKRGRDAILLRGGRIYLGVDRDIPTAGEAAKSLTVASGLLSVQLIGRQPKDPAFAFADAPAGARPPMRRVFRIELVGAPDILIGDVVQVVPNPGDSLETGLVATLAAVVGVEEGEVSIYVSALTHRIGKNQGFKTTLTGVEIDPDSAAPDAIWDVHTEGPLRDSPPPEVAISDGTPEGALALEVSQLVARQLGRVALPTVAEIRSHDLEMFSSGVIRGVRDNRSAGLTSNMVKFGVQLRTGQGAAEEVPYVTPFAWGPFGQVLPRYPGMRVMLDHRAGARRDPVDIGAVWHSSTSADAGGPRSVQQGDWWLSLPAGVPDDYGTTSDLSQEIMPPQDAKSANDLTDKDGNRIIEVGQFIIRVGAAALGDAGARPQNGAEAEAQAIVIEQKDSGAKIVLDKDGNISFTGRRISFDAEDVDIAVSGAMNVTKT